MHLKPLFLCLALLFTAGLFAQNRYYHEISLDKEESTAYSHIILDEGIKGDSVYLHLALNAYSDPQSFLHDQLREFQDVDFHFASASELGFCTIDSLWIDEELIDLDQPKQEFIALPAGHKIAIKYRFRLPSAEFTGNGSSENQSHIIDLLPRLAYWNGKAWSKDPVSFHYDINQAWDHFKLKLRSKQGLKPVTNLELKSAAPVANPFDWYLFEGEARSLQIHWAYQWYHYPIRENLALITSFEDEKYAEKLKGLIESNESFFRLEMNDPLQGFSKVLVLENKKGEYQSAQMLTLSVEKDWFQTDINLVQAQAEAYFRYRRYTDGWRESFIARGLPYYFKYKLISKKYSAKRWVPFSNPITDWLFAVDQFDYGYQNRFLFLFLQRQGLDQSHSEPVDSLSRLNYEAIVQAKSHLDFAHLRAFVGEQDFKRSMRRFITKADSINGIESLQESFQFYANQDLDWFFDTLLLSNEIYDYQLKDYDYCPTVSTATVKNTGDLKVPYSLTGYKDGKKVLSQWYEGHQGKRTVQLYHEDYDKVVLNDHLVNPEYRLKNNTYYNRWLLPRMEPLSFQLYNSFESPDKTQIFYVPSVYYNAYDKLLLGLNFSNKSVLVQKPFEYLLIPEFSFGTSKLTGSASFLYNYTTPKNHFFRQISFGFYSRYYHYDQDLAYSRFSPSITFKIRKPSPRSPYIQSIRLRGVQVNRELPANFEGAAASFGRASFSLINANYRLEYTNILRPTILRFHVETAEQFGKVFIDLDQRWMLGNKKWLIWRNYAGLFLYNNLRDQGLEDNFYSIGVSGTQDYLFDYYLIGRSDSKGIWSRQFFTSDGGFKSETGAFADRFLLSSNLSVPLIGPLGLFGDLALSEEQLYWDYGIRLAFLTDFLELYLPLQNQDRNFVNEANYLSNLRFVIDLDLGNIINRARRGFY